MKQELRLSEICIRRSQNLSYKLLKQNNWSCSLRNIIKNAIRNTMAFLPIIGLKKKPNFHENGISFIIPVKDEERWIEASISSIQEAADEIIVVDSSVEDSTTEIVKSLLKSNNKIKHIRFYCNGPHAFALSCHIGLVNVTYRWVFKWDSDFVAKSDEALNEWKRKLSQLNKDSYYVIDLPRINIEGDLHHQPKDCPFGNLWSE